MEEGEKQTTDLRTSQGISGRTGREAKDIPMLQSSRIRYHLPGSIGRGLLHPAVPVHLAKSKVTGKCLLRPCPSSLSMESGPDLSFLLGLLGILKNL